jgi:hypothetical protein
VNYASIFLFLLFANFGQINIITFFGADGQPLTGLLDLARDFATGVRALTSMARTCPMMMPLGVGHRRCGRVAVST